MFPTSYKKLLRCLDSSLSKYIRMDVCLFGCVVFTGKFAELHECPVCNSPRFKKPGTAHRYFWCIQTLKPSQFGTFVVHGDRYSPFAGRLRDIYGVEVLANLAEYWKTHGVSDDSSITDVYDGKLWKV